MIFFKKHQNKTINSAEVAREKLKEELKHTGRFSVKQKKSMQQALLNIISDYTGLVKYSSHINVNSFDNNPDLALISLNVIIPRQELDKIQSVLF